MASLESIDYAHFDVGGKQSIFDYWERQFVYSGMTTPSVFDSDYRSFVIDLLLAQSRLVGTTLLSLGCGNGFLEKCLAERGLTVLATDVDPIAINFARSKGLEVLRLDALEPWLCQRQFDIVYCDGLLGHLWDSEDSFDKFFRAVASVVRQGSVLVTSNDLSNGLTSHSTQVTGNAHAQFFRGSLDYLRSALARHAFLRCIEEYNYPYYRIQRGLRLRQISVIQFVFGY